MPYGLHRMDARCSWGMVPPGANLEGAVLTGEYENEPCELVIAPTAEAGAIALSHHRLNQIRPMLHELNAQDRHSLVDLLRSPDG